jgi:hypothetical protein
MHQMVYSREEYERKGKKSFRDRGWEAGYGLKSNKDKKRKFDKERMIRTCHHPWGWREEDRMGRLEQDLPLLLGEHGYSCYHLHSRFCEGGFSSGSLSGAVSHRQGRHFAHRKR